MPAVKNEEENKITIVLPGDDVTSHITKIQNKSSSSKKKNKKPIKIGTGLELITLPSSTPQIKCTLAGRLQYNSSSNTIYILTNTKRYIPQTHDRIIGIIESRMGDYYRVSIPGCTMGSNIICNTISFEGATKRNRPYLGNGDLIYARVVHVFDFTNEVEISCIVNRGRDDVQKVSGDANNNLNDDGGASRKDWMTDEGTYGHLKNGTCLQISIGLAQELLHPNNVVLHSLGTSGMKFEICIGVNGYVWVHSERPEYTILILNAIQNSEVMTENQVRAMVKALVKTVRQSILED
jgi:exosome complex component RRP40